MTKFAQVQKNLEDRGYAVRTFATGAEAAAYLDGQIDGKTVGFGGSMTLQAMGLWDLLHTHNTVYSHLNGFPFGPEAANAQIYISSANALAETGEIVNIDAYGNRVAGTLFGHEKVVFVIGRNKLTATYEDAVWRARNVAAPLNARRKQLKTPCAVKADRCYNCKSPDRICQGMVTLWGPMMGMAAEVLLVDEDLGF